jgi:hypothetical protein
MDDLTENDNSHAVAVDIIAATIAEAEVVTDPLEGLIERVQDDKAAAYAPEVLYALIDLRGRDFQKYMSLRFQLKALGVGISILEEQMRVLSGSSGDDREPTTAEILIELAKDADLFRTPDQIAYADIAGNGGHRETWAVKSAGFRRWLTLLYFAETNRAPNAEGLQAALNTLEAKALTAPCREVYVRVGGFCGEDGRDRLYLDLCDEAWRAVEIDSDGWRIVESPPVRFRRSAGMKPLPVPEQGGSIEALRQFLNVASDADFVLAVAWILAALHNRGPYPLLAVLGEQGSAKSTFAEILRSLIDPNTAPLRALPREERDLFITANNTQVLAFDNVSTLPGWLSDAFCRLATGGGFAVRQLYSDQEEVLFNALRPIILNGIEDFIQRPDLADRGVLLHLKAIPEDARRPLKDVWAAFVHERPRILGVVLDAAARGLRDVSAMQLEKLPRMADFAKWASACETSLWPAGTFWAAYTGNRDHAVNDVLEADPVAAGIRALMAEKALWEGTASELLDVLANVVGEAVTKGRDWPKTPKALSGRLRRAATFLRKVGIDVEERRVGRHRRRVLFLSQAENKGYPASAASAVSATEGEGNQINVLMPLDLRTQDIHADAYAKDADAREGFTSSHKCLKMHGMTDADDADGKNPAVSGAGKTGWGASI